MIHIDKARSVLGVKFKHCGRSTVEGLDCIGLVDYALPGYFPPGVVPDKYKRIDKTGALLIGLRDHMTEIEKPETGSVIVWSWPNGQQHCAIVTKPGWVIHSVHKYHKVVETPIPMQWDRNISGFFMPRGL